MSPRHRSERAGETLSRPFRLAVASGKGGTGKTLVATNLAVAAARRGTRVTLVDCDVDAPNDHLFLARGDTTTTVVTAPVATVDAASCTACGACSSACAFGAIRVLGRSALVFDELCHGCGLCERVCRPAAVAMRDLRIGVVEEGDSALQPDLRLASGVLDIGQVKAPDVIRAAIARGATAGAGLAILDAPPGVACSVVAAARDADALLLVTEPTPFGEHDLVLAARLGRDLGVPMAMVANKVTRENESVAGRLARTEDITLVSSIPFDRRVAEVYAGGRLVIDEVPSASGWLGPVMAWVDEMREQCVAAGEAIA